MVQIVLYKFTLQYKLPRSLKLTKVYGFTGGNVKEMKLISIYANEVLVEKTLQSRQVQFFSENENYNEVENVPMRPRIVVHPRIDVRECAVFMI